MSLGEPEAAVYLFRDLTAAEDGLCNWLGEQFEEDEALVILEINLDGVAACEDPAQFELVVRETISPSRIVRVLSEDLEPVADLPPAHHASRSSP